MAETAQIDINEMYKFVQFVANKEQSGFIKPSEFNIAAERAQMQLFMQRYGNPKEYSPGYPVPRVAFAQSQKVQDDFNPFIMSADFSDGKIYLEDLSCGYIHLIALISDDDVPIKLVDASEYFKIENSALLAPTDDYPIAYFGDNKTIYVSGVDDGVILYLRHPNVPKWEYFKNSQGQALDSDGGSVVSYPVFDDTATTDEPEEETYDCDNTHNTYENSVNFEFPYDCFNEIASMILSYVGINLREPMLTQYAEAKQTQGI
tara:strand:- start:345 stop:1127 length:783 start_codon:yes stop_codon:yes gene_type:complete